MCGQVRFAIDAMPRGLLCCNCARCQRRTGTGFSVSAVAAPGSVTVTEGGEHVRSYEPETGFHKQFCDQCGSQLFATDPASGNGAGGVAGNVAGLPIGPGGALRGLGAAAREAGVLARGTRFATTASGTTYSISEGWVAREAANGKGIVYQRPATRT